MIVIIFSFNFDNFFNIQNLTSSVILIKAVSSQNIDEDKDC